MKKGLKQGRKKVLFLITKSNWGGAQRYVYDLATNLSPDEFEPVVAFGPDADSDAPGLLGERLATAGVRTVLIPALRRDMGLIDLAALRAIGRVIAAKDPDIIHLNSSKAAGLGALAGRIHRVPRIIFTAHGWPFREARGPLSRLLIWCASVATIILSHATICVSESDRRSLSWIFGRRLVTIRNALSPQTLLPRDEAREALGIAHDRIAIGSIAELTANKQIALGIAAVYRVQQTRAQLEYHVIGDGELRAKLEAQARAHSVPVRFHGNVPDAAQYLKAFDALLIPSKKEGLPYVMLEAHAAGVPIIASSVGGIPECAQMSDTLCPSGNIDCFVRALEAVVPAGSAAEENTRVDFDTMVRETERVYRAPMSSV